MTRTVILHYHLFKNAGTSLDQILRRNFGSRWVTREFPVEGGDNSAQVAEWIRTTPEAVAFSTHTAVGPLPEIDGVDVVSVILLRDPVARLRSVYRFERDQEAETLGANLAKTHAFEDYVHARLGIYGDRQCRNFHTDRLSRMIPGDSPELDRARVALQLLSVVGLVERFDDTVAVLAHKIRPAYPDFTWDSVRANTTTPAPRTAADQAFDNMMEEVNADDRQLIEQAGLILDAALPDTITTSSPPGLAQGGAAGTTSAPAESAQILHCVFFSFQPGATPDDRPGYPAGSVEFQRDAGWGAGL